MYPIDDTPKETAQDQHRRCRRAVDCSHSQRQARRYCRHPNRQCRRCRPPIGHHKALQARTEMDWAVTGMHSRLRRRDHRRHYHPRRHRQPHWLGNCWPVTRIVPTPSRRPGSRSATARHWSTSSAVVGGADYAATFLSPPSPPPRRRRPPPAASFGHGRTPCLPCRLLHLGLHVRRKRPCSDLHRH